jgi:hypothetical protein
VLRLRCDFKNVDFWQNYFKKKLRYVGVGQHTHPCNTTILNEIPPMTTAEEIGNEHMEAQALAQKREGITEKNIWVDYVVEGKRDGIETSTELDGADVIRHVIGQRHVIKKREEIESSTELDGADVIRHVIDKKIEEKRGIEKSIELERPDIENLVFRGGGVKGIAYCGALKVLNDLHLLDNVKR